MDRLSPLDASFLHLERDVQQLHVGSALIFEGPAPTYDELCNAIDAKLALVPRYRQRVRRVPFELGRPVWVDDPQFDLHRHVRHKALRRPGTERQLCTLAAGLMFERLDLSRPLWETSLVTDVTPTSGLLRVGAKVVRPETVLDGPIGPRRRWGWARADLAQVKDVKNALGGTVNDVVLAAISGGLRTFLLARGERVDGRTIRSRSPCPRATPTSTAGPATTCPPSSPTCRSASQTRRQGWHRSPGSCPGSSTAAWPSGSTP